MPIKNAVSFVALYFAMSHLAIVLDAIVLYDQIRPSANFVVMIISIKLTLFGLWKRMGAMVSHLVAWSAFCSCVALLYLMLLPTTSQLLFNTAYPALGMYDSLLVLVFNFVLSAISFFVFSKIKTGSERASVDAKLP